MEKPERNAPQNDFTILSNLLGLLGVKFNSYNKCNFILIEIADFTKSPLINSLLKYKQYWFRLNGEYAHGLILLNQ